MASSSLGPSNPSELLPQVLEDVRAGRFSPKLRAGAQFLYDNRELFRSRGDEVAFGRCHSLLWEIHDQAGRYKLALEILESVSIAYLAELQAPYPAPLRVEDPTDETRIRNREIARQKVMCCLALGFALYRRRRYQEAKTTLDTCELFLNNILIEKRDNPPSPFHCWGALARLHYFYGQILRAEQTEQDFTKARERFALALDCANQRILEKKNLQPPLTPEKLAVEQVFANHCTGKVLAFGFGWISLLQGELSRAREFFQAASVLLNDSQDEYLVRQVELFFCAASRAKNGAMPNDDGLIKRMVACSEQLREHPEYYLQSLRHVAVAHLNAARASERDAAARNQHLSAGRQLVKTALGLCGPEYRVLATVLSSRLEAAAGNSKLSLKLASDAHIQAHDSQEKMAQPIVAEAALAKAEALTLGDSRSHWTLGVHHGNEALKLAKENRVVSCACYLHLAELYLKLNDILNAVRSFSEWQTRSHTVEHQWLRQKAETLKEKISKRRMFFVPADDSRKYQSLGRDFVQFLIDREKLKPEQQEHFNYRQAADSVGVSEKTFREWDERLSIGADIHFQIHFQKPQNSRGRKTQRRRAKSSVNPDFPLT